MRLNRRELGTGLLRRCLLPVSLVLVAIAATFLFLGARVGKTATATSSALAPTGKQLTHPVPPMLASFGHLPLSFEPNRGQTDPRVHFIARGSGYGLFLTVKEAVLALARPDAPNSVVRMKLSGANSHAQVEGRELLPGKSNYYIGNNPSRWQVGIPQYARVRYSQVYPGIDLVYYGSQGQLEYDFEIAPGADPRQVQLAFAGSHKLELQSGDLKITTAGGEVRLQAPRVYQEIAGSRQSVAAKFAQLAADKVGFELGDYDHSQRLVIDPVLTYSTYLGGTGTEFLPSIAVDSAPNIYLTGATTSTDFPLSSSPYQGTLNGTSNVFVTKLDPTGSTLLFSTYLGGSGMDTSAGIAADAAGNAYLAGTTTSSDFPNKNAFQTAPVSPGNPHAFVSELTASGTLQYSTYLSGHGTDTVKGMTLDNKGFVYVIGITDSTDFPLAPVAGTFQSTLQGANAFFISKLAPNTSGANSLVFSTYFGGGNPANGTVSGGAIAVDNNANGSNIYFTGGTTYIYTGQNAQTDFPIKNAFQFCLGNPGSTSTTTCSTSVTEPDAFVAKLNPGTNTGAQLLYCTYLGGSHTDIGQGIGLDASGNAYVTGSTNSSDHPAVSGAIAPYQASLKGGTDAFVAKVNNPATGTGSTSVLLTYFSYLGGSDDDVGNAMAVDNVQGARVIGTTKSTDFPVTATNAVQAALKGTQDAFVARLDTTSGGNSSTSQFVTYLGGSGVDTGTGIAIDSDSNTLVTGETQSADFTTVNPFQAALKGTQDIFAARLGPNVNFDVQAPNLAGNTVNAGNQVSY
ncbi:MAG TPA: SBBP repeat-containing protein, partial [Terriglobales bacterium]|nr:SBBP repeat-containing protein [Terriglobales bacterium]